MPAASESATVRTPARPSNLRKFLRVAVAGLLVVAVWIAADMYWPRTTNIREFDSNEVARLETDMWRSYYDKRRLALFVQLAELMRKQFRFPFFSSNMTAFHAARAAFVFKGGRGRIDYEKALPDLRKFYSDIRKSSSVPFDVERAARLELEWWIVHRERAQHKEGDLERALADLGAEIYRVPVDRLAEHARLRAEAMIIRDTKAAAGGVTEEDWKKIHELLKGSWKSLHEAVNQ